MIDLIVCANHLAQCDILPNEIQYAQDLGLEIRDDLVDRCEYEMELAEDEVPKYAKVFEKRLNDTITYWNTNSVDGMMLWNDHLQVVTYRGDSSGIGSGSFKGCKGLPREFINTVLRDLDIYYKSEGRTNVTLFVLFLDIMVKDVPMIVIDSSWYKS